ncbi:E3 SUMO-protein ligase ZBED1-like [Venturia canescens]|uniref:E3 SUMO-protein ligase ZBED1-like n=1 Tax=Venturia canescens TaxID=32260 RepID=UPI001C9C5CF2|nr:E3 SUMO-protein ligase ZBED1-like [Venturia canescens]
MIPLPILLLLLLLCLAILPATRSLVEAVNRTARLVSRAEVSLAKTEEEEDFRSFGSAGLPKVRQSVVWKFFLKSADNDGDSTCKICNRAVKSGGKGGGTTNLRNHLTRNHSENAQIKLALTKNQNGDEYTCNQQQGNISEKSIALSMPSASSTSMQMDLSESDCDSPDSPTHTSSPALSETRKGFISANVQKRSSAVQPKIDSSFKQIRSFEVGGSKAGEITNAILFMIAKDNMPFQMVENEGFRNLMKTTVPLYSMPGRKSITKKLEEKYEYLVECEKEKLKTIDYFSVTSDVWTDVLNTISYLGVTLHYEFDKELQSTTVGVTELTERHTAEVIGGWLKNILQEWRIDDNKIVAIITDNASNMKKAVKDFFGLTKHISCFAHSINLVAEDTMDFNEATTLCMKIKKIVTYFKQSTIAADELRKATHLKLTQSVETRWNSTFAMLTRFSLLSKEVGSILLSNPSSPEMLTASELQLANEIVRILQPLEKVTTELCAEKIVTVSKVIPLINCLKNKIAQLRKNLETPTAFALLDRLEKSVSLRFGQIENNPIMAIATILDPRFKKLHFNDRLAYSKAINRIGRSMTELDQTVFSNDKTTETPVQVHSQSDDLWSFHDVLLNTNSGNAVSAQEQNQMPTDLRHYLNQPMVNRTQDPIHYWSSRKTLYPTLWMIAQKYLSIVATSVPSERLFSRAGNILTDSRSRLSPDHLQQLLFLNSLSIKDWQLEKQKMTLTSELKQKN